MKKNPTDNQDRDSYQTGSTKPPKSYQGVIAVLLILVIFLGGIVSALGMMNIRLFQLLENQAKTTEAGLLQFSRQQDGVTPASYDGYSLPALGLTVQEVTELCRSYYGWPEGLYISGIASSGPAAGGDLRQGDILMTLDGVSVVSESDLAAVAAEIESGHTLLVTVYRSGSHITLPLTVGE